MSKGRLIIVQPALPIYREDFFERLHAFYGSRFLLFYSDDDLGDISSVKSYSWKINLGRISSFRNLLFWQNGVLGIQLDSHDCVVLSGAPRFLSTLCFIVKCRLLRVDVIWWGHYWSSTSKSWRYAVRMLLLRACNGLLFYTDQEIAEYRSSRFFDSKIYVDALNNGLNVDRIGLLRKNYAADTRLSRILYIGRLTGKASLELLLTALASLRASDVMLDIIGSGPEEASLKLFAEECGISNRITWHGGISDEHRISEVANRCRLFVYPGAVGLSLIHAMAYGLPSIVHNDRWSHMPEFAAFTDGETGRNFLKGDSVSLANALDLLIHNSVELNRFSNISLNRVSKSYNTRKMADRMFAFLRRFGFH